jgi:hypothetical protein
LLAVFFEVGGFGGRRTSRWWRRRTVLPCSNYEYDSDYTSTESDEGEDPCGAIEARGGGGGKDRGAVFLDERLLHQAVAIAAGNGGHEFVAHAIGIGAADVVAFEQDLAAAADAHQLVADFLETGGRIAGTGESENSEGEQDAVESAAEDGMWGRHHLGTLDFRLQRTQKVEGRMQK